MFVAELLLPWAIFAPTRWRRLRLGACAGLVLLQIAIGATGNYGFFSILSVVLCLTLVDDCTWMRVLPLRLVERARSVDGREPSRSWLGGWRRRLAAVGAIALFALGGLTFAREIASTVERSGRPSLDLTWSDRVIGWVQPFRSINGYGLFRVMTVERPEIVIEGSLDGLEWTEWNLRWKPGDPNRRPGLVAPHQPRLDWQLWFAALDPRGASYWLSPLLTRLLEGAPPVTALVGSAAFADATPRYLRLAYYRLPVHHLGRTRRNRRLVASRTHRLPDRPDLPDGCAVRRQATPLARRRLGFDSAIGGVRDRPRSLSVTNRRWYRAVLRSTHPEQRPER